MPKVAFVIVFFYVIFAKYLKQNCKTTLASFFFIYHTIFFMAHTCNFMPRFNICLAFHTHRHHHRLVVVVIAVVVLCFVALFFGLFAIATSSCSNF